MENEDQELRNKHIGHPKYGHILIPYKSPPRFYDILLL